MKKLLGTLLLLLLCSPLTASSRSAAQRYAKEHNAMHWIVTEDDTMAGGCTATAIGPHALLTAEHCDIKDVDEDGNKRDGSPILFFVDQDGKPDYLTAKTPYQIQAKIFDGHDHMILLLSGPAFKDFLQPELAAPYQGENVFWFGNPAGIRDQYREGYVTGKVPLAPPFQDKAEDCWLVSASVVPGDSGSAVFDAKTRKLVGVVTYGINDGMFMGMFTLHFTPLNWLLARVYNGAPIVP